MIPLRYQGTLWIFGAACSYATVALFGKWTFLLQIPLSTALSWRFIGAAVIVWIWLRFQEQPPLPIRSKLSCLGLGLFGDTLRSLLFFTTVGRLGASLAALLLYTFPLFVFLLQRFIFKQAATRLQWLGLFLSSAGCAMAVLPSQSGGLQWSDWLGVLTGIGAGFVEANYISFSGHITKGISPIRAVSYVARGASLSFCLIALSQGHWAAPATPTEWTLAFCLALFATTLPIFCLMKGIQITGATQASLLFTIEPFITILLAILFFGESLTVAKTLGSLLILGSALLIQQRGPEKVSVS